MKIKEVMKKAVTVRPETTKKELLRIAKKHPDAQLFIVVDKNKKFLGDIHENDLFYMLLPNESFEDIGIELGFDLEKKFFAETAGEIMRKHDITCNADEEVLSVSLRLAKEEVNEMPVLDKNRKVIGVINEGILLRCL